MNLQNIFDSTDFVHASGTKEELAVAEFLKGQCESLGVPARIEPFRVAMSDIEEAHLFADGKEIPCKAFNCCGSGVVEGELYYMPFEMTICSREGFSWFYSNIYEQKPVLDVKETVEKIKTAFAAKNVVVINMPPNIHGKLVEGDVKHLMDIGKELGILRV